MDEHCENCNLENSANKLCKKCVTTLEILLEIEREERATLEAQPQAAQAEIADLNEALEDKRRLAREIDEIINGKEGMALQASLCDIQKDVKRIEAENTALRANSLIQEHIINHGSDPKDKEEIVRLIMENAALRADNAAMVNKFRQIHRHIHPHNVPWYSPEIDHICDSVREISHPGDSLLKELEALRAVKGLAVKLLDSVDVENEITWALLDALAAVKGSD